MRIFDRIFAGGGRRRRAGAVLAQLRPLSENGDVNVHPACTLEQVLALLQHAETFDGVPPEKSPRTFESRSSFEADHTVKILLRSVMDRQTYRSPTMRRDYLCITRLAPDRWTWYLGSSHYQPFDQPEEAPRPSEHGVEAPPGQPAAAAGGA